MGMKGTYRIGLYEKALPAELTWRDRLRIAKEAGYDYMEMSIDETDDRIGRLSWSGEQIAEIRSIQAEEDFYIESIVLSAQRRYPMGSLKWEKESLELTGKAILFARKMGIRLIMLQGYDVFYEESGDESSALRFQKNLKKLVDYAAAYGILLGMETMDTKFMDTVEKVMRSVADIASPYYQIYLDVGNVNNGTDHIITDLEKGRGHLCAAHLKDTVPGKCRDIPYGEGRVNFPAVIAKLYAMGVRRYVAEFWHHPGEDSAKVASENRKYLDRKFDEAEQLL